jgi:tetratricopeptide (TPR) repeat protein
VLADDLGVEPGRAARAMQAAILRQDPALDPPPGDGRVAVAPADSSVSPSTDTGVLGGARPVPRQLPADVAGFVGRGAGLAALDRLLDPTAPANTVVVSAVSGTAGVGKTALALHWAHRVAELFPDGQLYVNLRGYDASGVGTEPAEAVRGFLDAFNVAPAQIPTGLDAMAALYRSLMAGRRMLVLLDNARDAEQVRPLLPGSAGCRALVTSRDRLAGLVATDGAEPVALDLLSPAEADALLRRRLGPRRLADEPDAVDDIIARCARLPLALTVVAARAATRPRLALRQLAAELGEQRLDTLTGGDHASDLRAVFSWSYERLSPPARRLFRLLGLHPGPDIGRAATASLAGLAPGPTRRLLDELCAAHLLTEYRPDRYRLHDLLRDYAAELTVEKSERRTAWRRLLDHYLHSGRAAALRLNPEWDLGADPRLRRGEVREPLTTLAQAMTWFGVELPVLIAVIRAAGPAYDADTWRLAWTLTDYVERGGRWGEWETAHLAGLAAAERLADPYAQAFLHRGLGRARMWQGRPDESSDHLRRSLELFAGLGDLGGQARVHHNLSQLYGMGDDNAAALAHAREALSLARAIGDRAFVAKELNAVGWWSAHVGDLEPALAACEEALALFRVLGDPSLEASTLDSVGFIRHRLGHHEQAIERYEEAARIMRHLGDRYGVAIVHLHLGDSHHALGRDDRARAVWERALAGFEALAHPGAEEARARLDALQTQLDAG